MVDHLQVPVHIFNWQNNFLSEHIQHKEDILHGTMFTPELMVASDITPKEIRKLSAKFDQCLKKQCYNTMIYHQTEELKNLMKPPLIMKQTAAIKTEL